MRRARLVLCLAASVAAVLVAGSAARAETPITASTAGSVPRVSVDAAGTGHVTWQDTTTVQAGAFNYCQLGQTATACANTFTYSDANQDLDGGYALLPSDGRVLLLEARGVTPGRAKLLWTSIDGGRTFTGPTTLGTMDQVGNGIGADALYVPTGALGLTTESIFTIGQLSGITAPFQATSTVAGTTNLAAQLTPSVAASIALQDGTLVAALSDFNTVSWTSYRGVATYDALNDPNNWSPPVAIGPRSGARLDTRLASGAGGLWLGYVVDTDSGNNAFVVRRFEGGTWSAPTTVATNIGVADLVEDASGRLHALWTDNAGLRYRSTTSTANASWNAPQTLVSGESVTFPRLAVNAAGIGWAVWTSDRGVRAIPIRPAAVYNGPNTSVTTNVTGGSVSLGVPRNCVQPGQRFRVTLSWKRQKKKGNVFVKVTRSDFYVGTTRLKIDKTVPFVYTYNVKATQPRGSTISLRARAFMKVKTGKQPKKSVYAKIKVCS